MPIETDRTAVVVVDMQYECIEADGAWPIYNKAELLANARVAIAACRARGLPIGSGAVEGGGANLLIAQRLKRPGCRWSYAGAHAVLTVRAHLLSGRSLAA